MATFIEELKCFFLAIPLWEKVAATIIAVIIAAFFRWLWKIIRKKKPEPLRQSSEKTDINIKITINITRGFIIFIFQSNTTRPSGGNTVTY